MLFLACCPLCISNFFHGREMRYFCVKRPLLIFHLNSSCIIGKQQLLYDLLVLFSIYCKFVENMMYLCESNDGVSMLNKKR